MNLCIATEFIYYKKRFHVGRHKKYQIYRTNNKIKQEDATEYEIRSVKIYIIP